MTRIREHRRWRCKACNAVVKEPELLHAPSPFQVEFELTGCPNCRDCAEGFVDICDEPGCDEEATNGRPTGNNADAWGGYRRTCYAHLDEGLKS